MATAEKTGKRTLFQQEDYPSEDVYESEDDGYEPEPKRVRRQEPQPQRQRGQHNNPIHDEDDEDYASDEPYSDEYEDDDGDGYDENHGYVQGKSIQPYKPGRQPTNNNIISSEDTVDQKEKSVTDEEGLKLRLDLNLDIEVELKAHIHGDITLSLLA